MRLIIPIYLILSLILLSIIVSCGDANPESIFETEWCKQHHDDCNDTDIDTDTLSY